MKTQNKKLEMEFVKRWHDPNQRDLTQEVKKARKSSKDFKSFDFYYNLFKNFAGENLQARILDVCCASGYVTQRFYEKGYHHLSGFDLVPFWIKIAKKAFPKIKFFVSDAERIDLPKESVDIILVTNALHHFPSFEEVAPEFNRILSARGKVFAVEPYGAHPLNLFNELMGRLKKDRTENEFPVFKRSIKKGFSRFFNVRFGHARLFTKLIIMMEKR